MDDSDLSPEQIQARSDLHDFMQARSALLGPWDEDGDPVGEHKYLTGWVLMAAWTDEHGGTFLMRICSENLPGYQRVGLLHEGLYGFDD